MKIAIRPFNLLDYLWNSLRAGGLLACSGIGVLALLFCTLGHAKVEIKDTTETEVLPPAREEGAPPKSGRDKARTYFQREPAQASSGERYLTLHLGTFLSSEGYKWGSRDKIENPGNITAGVTYRIGEWVNSMDLLFRGDFSTYSVDGQNPVKMSLLPMILFPDSKSGFPLYFGGGLGLGVFFKQISPESALSLDYQLVAGARLMDVLDNVGFLIETGLKNQLHILSDGQFNGFFVSFGTTFTF